MQNLPEIIKKAGDEWDAECKEAYDLGFFDTPKEKWIADKIEAAKKAQMDYNDPYISNMTIMTILEELNSLGIYHGGRDFGLPLYDMTFVRDAQFYLRRILEKK